MERALPLRALLLTLPVQLAALGASLTIRWILGNTTADFGIGFAIGIHTALAAMISHTLGFTRPWVILNGVLPIAFAVSSGMSISPLPFLIAGGAMALLFLPALWSRIPYYPTSHEVDEKLLALLPTDRNLEMVDLGCGFGALLFRIARHRPRIQFLGVELSPLAFVIAKFRSLLSPRGNVTVRFRSLWGVDLSQFNFVYCFLAPPPMADLWTKVQLEMKPGSTFITNTFPVPAIPSAVERLADERQNSLFIHRL